MTDICHPYGYTKVIVAFSGGKDSIACVLHLLDIGVSAQRIELWHHDVDGREGSTLMDWPITRDYCRAFAEAFGLPIYYSWKKGGFEGEMDRDNAPTARTYFEVPSTAGDSVRVSHAGGKGPLNTRGLFPQVSADLAVRWCSAYLKIDVGSLALRNQNRFNHTSTLMVTGERAQESTARAKYKVFETDRADGRDGRSGRLVDHWRPVHAWREEQVWDALQRYGVNPHPAYRLGWGRVSCSACIFGNPDQWASLRVVNPRQFEVVALREANTGQTIQRKRSVRELADRGTPYPMTADAALVALATGEHFYEPIRLTPSEWQLPAGAYGDSTGPT